MAGSDARPFLFVGRFSLTMGFRFGGRLTQRRSRSAIVLAGSMPRARATSRNSATSSRRSPRSNFETKDCGRPSFFARATCVIPASRRACTRILRNCAGFRLNADFVTGRVCYPKLEYPKTGYTESGSYLGKPAMPTNDPDRLRAALDEIANALQPAVLVASQLQRASATAAQDAATIDGALTRVMTILKSVQPDRLE